MVHHFTLLFSLLYTVAFQTKYFSYMSHRLTGQNNFLTPPSNTIASLGKSRGTYFRIVKGPDPIPPLGRPLSLITNIILLIHIPPLGRPLSLITNIILLIHIPKVRNQDSPKKTKQQAYTWKS